MKGNYCCTKISNTKNTKTGIYGERMHDAFMFRSFISLCLLERYKTTPIVVLVVQLIQ